MSGISFDPDAIRALAQILRDTDLNEIELSDQAGSKLRVARAAPVAAPVVQYAAAPAPAAAAPA
ncbi:acetyl-CoA carboxylase biotin carboxyl carrier protein, partial [Roseomonas aerophila]|nr:acetyl-CoA carboxylase biotin carboxyl carrier protein [Pseudoroseomonas aerophila]